LYIIELIVDYSELGLVDRNLIASHCAGIVQGREDFIEGLGPREVSHEVHQGRRKDFWCSVCVLWQGSLIGSWQGYYPKPPTRFRRWGYSRLSSSCELQEFEVFASRTCRLGCCKVRQKSTTTSRRDRMGFKSYSVLDRMYYGVPSPG
jgi:hypothetical protein